MATESIHYKGSRERSSMTIPRIYGRWWVKHHWGIYYSLFAVGATLALAIGLIWGEVLPGYAYWAIVPLVLPGLIFSIVVNQALAWADRTKEKN